MQNLKNHKRYHPLYHYVGLPLLLLVLVLTVIKIIQNPTWVALYVSAITLLNIVVFLLLRVYANKNQDRIIRLEMRQRYFELSRTSFTEKEKKLKLAQIIALRFAGDNELLQLIEETISKGLSANQIKQSIQNWQADNHRI